MQGSLESPPIVIASDRRKAGFFLAGALAVFAITAWFSWRRYGFALPPFDKGSVFYFALVIFLFVGVVFAQASPIILSPNGFGFSGQVTPWNEVEEFSVGSFKGIMVIEVRYSLDHAGGEKGACMGLWPMPHDELEALLNAARERWSVPLSQPPLEGG